HVELRRPDAAALNFFKTQCGARSERIQRGDERLPVGAGPRQRAYQHVAADSGKSVEIANSWHEPPLSYVPLVKWSQGRGPNVCMNGTRLSPSPARLPSFWESTPAMPSGHESPGSSIPAIAAPPKP